jgi:hypothetical protein
VLFSQGTNKDFLVPDSCRATVRNGNSISVDFAEDIIKNDKNGNCFCSFQTIWQVKQLFGIEG